MVELARQLVHTVSSREIATVLMDEQEQRYRRREERRPLGCPRTKPPSCPACHRFVVNVSARCGCGWEPGIGWPR